MWFYYLDLTAKERLSATSGVLIMAPSNTVSLVHVGPPVGAGAPSLRHDDILARCAWPCIV